jgi:hypothetical protein
MKNTPHPIRMRFWFQAAISITALAVGILTLTAPEWVETLTGWEPDRGSGGFELTLTALFGVVALSCGLAARRELRRSTPAHQP